MSKYIGLGIFIIGMYILQYVFTYLQMNSFRKYFSKFIRDGKVAIGIKKGAIKAGSIVLFCVNDIGIISNCAYVHGVSVFARFKEYSIFNKMNIKDLDLELLNNMKLEKNVKLAILNAKENFIKAENGLEIEMEKSPVQKFLSKIKK
ncbi:MAG: transcriptional regulator GutM [Tissierellia bacterium]|nr:transcriptional regulator GutM [Tissierellia bacterium]